MTQHEVAKRWINQSKESGHAHSLFYEGPVIYSWGLHFPIARLLPCGAVLFNQTSRSNSTSNHQGHVRSVAKEHRMFSVGMEVKSAPGPVHLQDYQRRIDTVIAKIKKRRTWLKHYLESVERLRSEANFFISYFGLLELKLTLPDEWPELLDRATRMDLGGIGKCRALCRQWNLPRDTTADTLKEISDFTEPCQREIRLAQIRQEQQQRKNVSTKNRTKVPLQTRAAS